MKTNSALATFAAVICITMSAAAQTTRPNSYVLLEGYKLERRVTTDNEVFRIFKTGGPEFYFVQGLLANRFKQPNRIPLKWHREITTDDWLVAVALDINDVLSVVYFSKSDIVPAADYSGKVSSAEDVSELLMMAFSSPPVKPPPPSTQPAAVHE